MVRSRLQPPARKDANPQATCSSMTSAVRVTGYLGYRARARPVERQREINVAWISKRGPRAEGIPGPAPMGQTLLASGHGLAARLVTLAIALVAQGFDFVE